MRAGGDAARPPRADRRLTATPVPATKRMAIKRMATKRIEWRDSSRHSTGGPSRGTGAAGSGQPGACPRVAPLQGASLVLGKPTPDAGVLSGLERPGEAFLYRRGSVGRPPSPARSAGSPARCSRSGRTAPGLRHGISRGAASPLVDLSSLGYGNECICSHVVPALVNPFTSSLVLQAVRVQCKPRHRSSGAAAPRKYARISSLLRRPPIEQVTRRSPTCDRRYA